MTKPMTTTAAVEFLNRITYKPGYQIEFEHPMKDMLRRVEFPDMVRMYVRAEVPDAYHPERKTVLAFIHEIVVRPGMSPHDLLLQVRHGLLDMERHELDEWLRFEGNVPFDPHRREGS